MSIIRCACALLVTPYGLRIVNNWPTVEPDVRSIDPDSTTVLHYTSWVDVISMNDTVDERSIADVFESACSKEAFKALSMRQKRA